MLYQFQVQSKVTQLYINKCLFLFRFFSHISHYRVLSRLPCDIQQILAVRCSVAQSCLTLCNPMDCSPSGSTVHRILQARILEWVAMLFFRGSSQPRDQTQVSCIAGGFFLPSEPPVKPTMGPYQLLILYRVVYLYPNPMSILIIKEFAKDEYLPPSRGTLQPFSSLILKSSLGLGMAGEGNTQWWKSEQRENGGG